MSTREFLVCVSGLSDKARWPHAYQDTAHRADTPEAIASIFGSYNA
jgi:hypothetical protein